MDDNDDNNDTPFQACKQFQGCCFLSGVPMAHGDAQVVTYTPKGRAWNRNSGTLGGTANAAFLALTYSKFVRQQHEYNQLQKRYVCWARGQLRYMLGGAGRSLVVGYGVDPPTEAQNEAASCQPAPTTCNSVRAWPQHRVGMHACMVEMSIIMHSVTKKSWTEAFACAVLVVRHDAVCMHGRR